MAFGESTNYHDVYVDEVTEFKESHMGKPIKQLDYQVGVNVTAIEARPEIGDYMCADNEILCVNNEPLLIF